MALVYLILLHIVLAFLIVKTGIVTKVKEKVAFESVVRRARVAIAQRYLQWADSSVPDQSVIFLGDSLTHGLSTAAVVPCAVNYGVPSARTDDLLEALPSYKALNRARAIVLNIGINDLGEGKHVGLDGRLNEIAVALRGTTPLIWSAMLPTGTKETGIDPAIIRAGNETIKALCTLKARCTFVDTWPLFTDGSGEIVRSLFLDDALHLSAAGYEVWERALKQASRGVVPEITHASRCQR